MPMIEISGLSKKFGRTAVLDNLSLTVEPATCVGIVGANGCGKSTLLSIIAGVLPHDSGEVKCNGAIGYIPQNNPLFDNLTVYDNLRLYYCDSRRNLKEDIHNGIIAEFGVDRYLRKTVRKLSGGMKKRLSIVCALSKDPDILVMDEPGASLDIICKEDICQYMDRYRRQGKTIIIASHEEGELKMCTDMYLMNSGRLTALSPLPSAKELMERMRNV